MPLIVYTIQTKVKGVKEDKTVKGWADLRKVGLFESTIKDSISYGRYLNTYTSIKSEKCTSVPFIINHINFIDEFVQKFKI